MKKVIIKTVDCCAGCPFFVKFEISLCRFVKECKYDETNVKSISNENIILDCCPMPYDLISEEINENVTTFKIKTK